MPLRLLVFPLRLHIANNSVLTMINRAVARFWDLLTEVCVLNAAPLLAVQCVCRSPLHCLEQLLDSCSLFDLM